MSSKNINEQILRLKEDKNAVILAHYYQNPEVQDIADHVGDSFALSKLAESLPNEVIVFCGVSFMAETAKILSPEKIVLLPVKDAGCPMADMATALDVKRLKAQYPDAAVVSYVNSSTEVKAMSDICCTSANAVRVINSLPHERIIFLPDENLGSFAAERIPGKEFILFDGFCPTHEQFMSIDVKAAREKYPDALLVVHPECRPEVRQHADFLGSTGQMIKFIEESDHKNFIIATESGILHSIRKNNPEKNIVILSPDFLCPNMKKTNLEHVLKSLQTMTTSIELGQNILEKARKPLMRMLDVG